MDINKFIKELVKEKDQLKNKAESYGDSKEYAKASEVINQAIGIQKSIDLIQYVQKNMK